MSKLKVKLVKQDIWQPRIGDMAMVARFSYAPGSLFQALGVGIVETLIRFKPKQKCTEALSMFFHHILDKARRISAFRYMNLIVCPVVNTVALTHRGA